MYKVVYLDIALKFLGRIPAREAERIKKKIQIVALDPYAVNNNCTRLQGRSGYRLRVGDWRVIYKIDDAIEVLSVQKIASRGSIYQ